tara:strand:- start:1123 stop:2292 length:1170 start_codon:yes stop_codon:yes gene_type:complete
MVRTAKAHIAGVFEHPTRKAVDKTIPQLHAELATGVLADAGLQKEDVDGFFCDGTVPGLGGISMAEYIGLDLRYTDCTETGGSSYTVHVGHAAQAIADGKCNVALISLAGRPRAEGLKTLGARTYGGPPEVAFEMPYGPAVVNTYAMVAMRHMHEFGTTPEQLAWIKVAASHHAQHNDFAVLRDLVTVEDVLQSPMIADPLHRLDCCVISDGGGAIIMVNPSIAKSLGDRCVKVLGQGEAIKHLNGGQVDLTYTAGVTSGRIAFEESNLKPTDIDYVSIYDSFTITVLITLEDLGFCERGQGGKFVAEGNLISGVGKLPFNTDGGGLCNNHPGNRGSMTKVIEAVRQLRGEAHSAVQVKNCALALAHGTGGQIGTRSGSATVILGGSDA